MTALQNLHSWINWNLVKSSLKRSIVDESKFIRLLWTCSRFGLSLFWPYLQKLIYYNVNPTVIDWIKFLLCFRKQRVKLNGFFSKWNDLISGIPQGTILGPILFIMYINDLPDVCKYFANIYLFADDAKLYEHVSCDDDHKSLQCGLNALQEWSDKRLLKLNASKCKTVFYLSLIHIWRCRRRG